MPAKYVLSVDIGSGGMSAARFDEKLEASGYEEFPWQPPLTRESVVLAFQTLAHAVQRSGPATAVAISSFMHSFMAIAPDAASPIPLYTWMDAAAPSGIAAIRQAIGAGFHQRTGCHYHPMFPVFKIACMNIGEKTLLASPKSWLVRALTGNFVEDVGMASATGLLNIHTAAWDDDILRAAKLSPSSLPSLNDPQAIIGPASNPMAAQFGIRPGTIVVNGSGDGFMANIGSGCESANRIAITLGTSAAVRQMVSVPALDPKAGTFCYRANSADAFLLGCASSNGGNVLDWARHEFKVAAAEVVPSRGIPIFLPWLNGERSLEWNAEMRPAWHGRTSSHTPAQLLRAVMEGVVFNLAQYVEVIEKSSGKRADTIVLSGNGFLDSAVAPILAALVSRQTLQPQSSGLGTLRGTALCAWRALGHEAAPAVERLLHQAEPVTPVDDDGLRARFERFKQIRAEGAIAIPG